MAFSRSLLIKGIAGGLGACTACAGGVGIYKSVSSSEKLTDKQLIEKAGLDCGLDGDELTGTDSKNCTVKDNEKINVKKEHQKEEGVSFQDGGTGKIKLYKLSSSVDYSNGLKFVVDSGDITLTKTGALTISTLGQYETYEIKGEGDKYYLSRKTEANKEKQRELGLGECEFPDSGNKNCSFNTEEIKKVKFDGQPTEGVTVTGTPVTLTITKTEDTSFTDGYRLTFTFPSGVDNPSIKANTPTDFKIKKGDGNALTLEKAWKNNEFANKAGLNCTNSNACTVTTPDGKLNVKVGGNKKENITSIGTVGKIKVEKEQEGYNQGLKFTITGGDVTLNDGEGTVSKLEQFETYEITEDGDKYYLTRKTGPEGDIKTSLGLPCDLPTEGSKECTVQAAQSKDVKFEGRGDQKPSEQITLKIEKTGDSSFPFGYKFTLISDKDVALSSTSTIKKNTDTVFKIKRESDNALSLEKVWKEAKDLAEKIGLTCSDNGGVTCTKSGSEKLNVKRGDAKREGIENIGNNAKIKAEKDQEGYNQGFKFTIINSSATLTGGVEGTISKLEQFETYEIVEEGGKYYLSRKTGPEGGIKNALGLPEDCNLTDSSVECSITSDQSKNVKFEGKDKGKPTVDIKLKIEKTKDSSFPFGYKFTLLSTKDVELSTSSTIKKNTDTVFKIKRKDSSNEISLEKAWSITEFATKAGLNCSGGDACTITSTINVKRESVKEDGKSKKGSNSSKIKFSKDQEGYNQGFKFEIEGGDFELNGTGSNITKLENFETYEIVEEGGKYYLSRKTKAWVKLREKLGLPNTCNFPTSSPCTITSSQLGSVNFYGKNKSASITNGGDVKLTIEEDNGYPKGYKFLLKNEGETISIPRTSPTSSPMKLIKGKEEEFKINESGNDMTLTKTFDIHEIAKRVSLNSCDEETKECTLGDKIRIYNSDSPEIGEKDVVSGDQSKKISYTEEDETYLRFKVSSSFNIQKTLSQGTATIEKGKYKITKSNNDYYLYKDNTPEY